MACSPVCCVIPKNRAARTDIQSDPELVIPNGFPSWPGRWWRDTEQGLLLWSPHGNSASRLCLLGSAHADENDEGAHFVRKALTPEQIIHNLGAQGESFLAHANGDFACAFWDSAGQRLLLARDPFGRRTLYLKETSSIFAVCSDLGMLLSSGEHAAGLDLDSAIHYLAFGLPSPGKTLVSGIQSLPAAHVTIWRPFAPLLTRRYFTPLNFEYPKVLAEPDLRAMQAVLDASITAESSVGRQAILLSGGIDSGYIASTAVRGSPDLRLHCYTAGFDGYPVDECREARSLAEEIGAVHHSVTLTSKDAIENLQHVLRNAVPCSAWTSITHRHLMSTIAADAHESVLSGLGSDEIFGGYWKYLQAYAKLRRYFATLPPTEVIDPLQALLLQPGRARNLMFTGIPRFFDESAIRDGLAQPYSRLDPVCHSAPFYWECLRLKPAGHVFEVMVAHELQHRVPDLLLLGFESIGSAMNVRSSYPFLHSEIASRACSLGATERFWRLGGRWKNKKVLRQIACTRLPEEVLSRKPAAYSFPILYYLQTKSFRDLLFDHLKMECGPLSGILRRDWLAALEVRITEQLSSPTKRGFKAIEEMWAIVTLNAWTRNWLVDPDRKDR